MNNKKNEKMNLLLVELATRVIHATIGIRLLYLSDYTYILQLHYVHVHINDLGGTRNIHVVDCVITERLCV